MQTSYKEIFYGIVFGFGAAALDTLIDARQTGESFVSGLTDHPGMFLYRLVFIVYGLIVGWLLWKNNQRERDMRLLMEQLRRFHHEYEAMAVVLHTNLQMLLTKNLPLSTEAEALLRSTYEKSRDLQALVRERPSV
jgi:H+/Cl- antiporter ClcA